MREIIYSDEFNKAVTAMGGYRVIDLALDTIMDGLWLNPYGFQKFENDFTSFRYAITKPLAECPSLIVIFEIDQNKDVILRHVESYERYLRPV